MLVSVIPIGIHVGTRSIAHSGEKWHMFLATSETAEIENREGSGRAGNPKFS